MKGELALFVGLDDPTRPGEHYGREIDVSEWWPAIPRVGENVTVSITLADGTDRLVTMTIDEVHWRVDPGTFDSFVWIGSTFKEWVDE